MAGHRLAGDSAAEGRHEVAVSSVFCLLSSVLRPLSSVLRPLSSDSTPKAGIAERGFLMEETSGDGEFFVPDGPDDVAREILASVFAAGFAVKKSDFAAVLNPIGVAHVHDVIPQILAVGHIRE